MKFPKIYQMYILSFLFTLHVSLSAFINSTFLRKIIPIEYVGLLFAIASIVTIAILSMSSNILKHFGNRKFVLVLLLINITSLSILVTSVNPILIGLSFVSILATNTLISMGLDIFVEHFGNPNTIGKTRGLYLTIANLAWLISPLITSILIVGSGGYIIVYIVALITVILMTLGLFFFVKDFKDKQYIRTPFFQAYRYLKENKHMLAITIIDFILQFFYAWMIIYTPLYLNKTIGFDWSEIGVIFTIMLSPFVIFELPIGLLIDKNILKKRSLLYAGFIIIIASTFLIPFIKIKNIAIWSLVLFITRFGASIIESTSEIYFFTHVTENDTFLLGIFRDMLPVAYVIAPLIATLVFFFLPFEYLFIILAIIMLTGLYYIPQLKHD